MPIKNQLLVAKKDLHFVIPGYRFSKGQQFRFICEYFAPVKCGVPTLVYLAEAIGSNGLVDSKIQYKQGIVFALDPDTVNAL